MHPLLDNLQKSRLQHGLATYNRFVLCAHVSPDGDAVGSTLGFYHYLKGMGKDVRVVLPNIFPDFLNWMPGADEIVLFDKQEKQARQLINNAEVICCLDFNVLSRLDDEMAEAVAASSAEFWMMDHHLQPADFCRITLSYPELSSTCEVVFRVIYELGGFPALSYESAQALYAGMCTDTGGFTYNSTRPELYFILSCLLEKGIDKDKIYRQIYHNNTLDRVRLEGYVLYEKLRHYEHYRATLFTLTREEQKRFRFQKGDAEGLVNIPLTIQNVRLSCSLREDTEKPCIMVSLRSVDDFPANQVAEEFFNGGGHVNAAGGKLFCSMEEAVDRYRQALERFESQLREGK